MADNFSETASVPIEVRLREVSTELDLTHSKLRSAQWRVEHLEDALDAISRMSKDQEHDLFSATQVALAALQSKEG